MESWARQELSGAVVPDVRLVASLAALAERISENSGISFSQAVGDAGRQGARRVFGHNRVNPEGMLAGHFAKTGARCGEHRLVLVAQDTTFLDYSTHKETEGLGPIDDDLNRQGLVMHSALAMSPEGLPLGLLHTKIWARDPLEFRKREQRKKLKTAQKESVKWIHGLSSIERHVPPDVEVLAIQDREADVFAFLAEPRRPNVHLLLRAYQPRRVEIPEWVEQPEGAPRTLIALMEHAPVLGKVDIMVPRRKGQPAQQARLTVRASSISVLPPKASVVADGYHPLTIHVVNAYEENPEGGEEGIHWVLICTRPQETLSGCLDMVRYYSMRWTIERLHYVLKSGYGVERLQIDNVARLMNAVALHYLVAWRVLYLTHLARTTPEAPASDVLAELEMTILSAATKEPVTTVAEAVAALAILGGQERYRNAPAPGPKRLWLGARKLAAMVEAWQLLLSILFGEM